MYVPRYERISHHFPNENILQRYCQNEYATYKNVDKKVNTCHILYGLNFKCSFHVALYLIHGFTYVFFRNVAFFCSYETFFLTFCIHLWLWFVCHSRLFSSRNFGWNPAKQFGKRYSVDPNFTLTHKYLFT